MVSNLLLIVQVFIGGSSLDINKAVALFRPLINHK